MITLKQALKEKNLIIIQRNILIEIKDNEIIRVIPRGDTSPKSK